MTDGNIQLFELKFLIHINSIQHFLIKKMSICMSFIAPLQSFKNKC